MKKRGTEIQYHLMLMPGMIFLILFSIVPMFGIVIAFENYMPTLGIFHSEWVGFANFIYMFQIPTSAEVFVNTIIIAVGKIIASLVFPLIFALLLNEVRSGWLKRISQTVVYLPYFLSWVILANIMMNILTLNGPVNQILSLFHIKPILFLASNVWFRPVLITTDTWKNMGFNTVVYLAAITGINPGLYEAAAIDGAKKWKQLLHVSIPGISSTIILLATLSLGNVLNAGFDQVFNLYNPLVYTTGDIIDTYVYRIGLTQAQYGLATAVGTMKSVISFILIILSYKLAAKFANYRIF